MVTRATRTAEVGGARIVYTVSGSAESPALLIVHGWGSGRADWDLVLDELGDDVRVIVPDLPSHGGSTTAGGVTIGDLADLVLAVLAAEGIASAVVAGHSMGGAIALESALHRPDLVTRVVGVDTYHYAQVYPAQPEEIAAGFLDSFRSSLEQGVAALVELSSVPTTPEAVRVHVRSTTRAVAADSTGLAELAGCLRWDLDAALDRSFVPIECMVAADLADPAMLARYANRITFDAVHGIGHYFPLEDAAGTAARLRAAIEAA